MAIKESTLSSPDETTPIDISPPSSSSVFEFYGFAVYLVSILLFVVFLLWAYIPDSILESIGIDYYPNKFWAVAIPAYFLIFMLFAEVFHVGYTLYTNSPVEAFDSITDQSALFFDDHASLPRTSVPELQDIRLYAIHQQYYDDMND